jgi:hypothetical protein
VDDDHRAGLMLDLDWLIDTRTILGSAETCLLITCLMDWDLDVCQGWLTTTVARLARIAEKNS